MGPWATLHQTSWHGEHSVYHRHIPLVLAFSPPQLKEEQQTKRACTWAPVSQAVHTAQDECDRIHVTLGRGPQEGSVQGLDHSIVSKPTQPPHSNPVLAFGRPRPGTASGDKRKCRCLRPPRDTAKRADNSVPAGIPQWHLQACANPGMS